MDQYKEKLIDGLTFQVSQFPGFPGLKMKARLAAVLGPALARLLPTIGAKLKAGRKLTGLDLEEVAPLIAPGIDALVANLKPEEFSTLCLDLLAGTRAKVADKWVDINTEAAFNSVFTTGQLGTLYKVIWLVFEVNGFFGLGGIGKRLAAPGPKAASPSGP